MKQVSTLILTLIFAAVLARCAHDAKRSSNDTLDYLNGNNYQTPGTGIPIVSDQKSPLSTISGSLLINTGTAIPDPLKYQTLKLMDGKKEIAKTMTDAGGNFVFTGYIPNGEYKVIILSKKYVVGEFVKITEYKTANIRLYATPNALAY